MCVCVREREKERENDVCVCVKERGGVEETNSSDAAQEVVPGFLVTTVSLDGSSLLPGQLVSWLLRLGWRPVPSILP